MKIFIAILTLLVIGGLGITYFMISSPIKYKEKESFIVNKLNNSIKVKNNNKDLFKLKFNLPARESFMKVDFRNLKNYILYKLTISLKDKYGAFNVENILDNNGVVYSLLESKKIEIFAFFPTKESAKKVFLIFNKYNLNVNIEKITQRI